MQTTSIARASSVSFQATRRIHRQASPTEMIYIKTATTVVGWSRVSGRVGREQFEIAVRHLEERFIILRSAVENGNFVARTDNESSVAAWISPRISSVESLYAKLLNAELDTNAMVYAIHVIAENDALDIFTLSSHSVTDATSLVELHSCLAHMCDCVVRGETPGFQHEPFPNSIDAAVRDVMALRPAGHGPALYSGAFAEIPMRAQQLGRSLSHRLERIVIRAEDTHRIGVVGHLNGASVHSLLLAAFALAIRDAAQNKIRQILLRSSVDLRRRLEPHVSPELVFSAISARITLIPDLDRPFFELAKYIFNDIHEGADDGSIFREYLNYPKSFGSSQQAPIALNVSDMQTVTFHWPTQRLKVEGFEYALGWSKKFPNVSVSIFEGTLIANIVYVEEFVDPEVVYAIAESVRDILVSL